MFFSVIVPTYRDSERLPFLLESLTRQTLDCQFWEVIIVNNDSDSALILADNFFPSYGLKILEEPKPGSYAARNRGISEANGEIIAFTDSDMLPDSDWLERAHSHFLLDKNRSIGILTGPVPLFFKNPSKLSSAEIYEKYTGFDFESYAKDGACGAGNWFSYKSVLEEFGGFREDLKSNGDTELSLRISKKYNVLFDPNLINRHPARYTTNELVFRYQRILGGTFNRRFAGNNFGFLSHTLNFVLRRYRFSLKKFFTLSLHESWTIFKVCNAINLGALNEYFHLVTGGDTKR